MTTTVGAAVTGLRPPYDLPQIDEYSCYTNVVAMIRWMFGLSDLQGAEAVREVDRLTERAPGEPSEVQTQLLLLAREGCHARDMTTLDLDRLRVERLAYIREANAYRWTPEWEERWTEAEIDRFITVAEVYRERWERDFAPYRRSGTVVSEKVQPQFGDFARFLDAGYVLPVLLQYDAHLSHAVLVYRRDGDVYFVYDPGAPGSLYALSGRELEAEWIRDTLVAVAPPAGVR